MKRNLARCLIIVVSICLIFIGLSRNEYRTVFKKATNICLECVGIG